MKCYSTLLDYFVCNWGEYVVYSFSGSKFCSDLNMHTLISFTALFPVTQYNKYFLESFVGYNSFIFRNYNYLTYVNISSQPVSHITQTQTKYNRINMKITIEIPVEMILYSFYCQIWFKYFTCLIRKRLFRGNLALKIRLLNQQFCPTFWAVSFSKRAIPIPFFFLQTST